MTVACMPFLGPRKQAASDPPWLSIPGCLWYVRGSTRVESGGKVISATDEIGGADFEQATPANQFDPGVNTFVSATNTAYHLQRTSGDPTAVYGNGTYSMFMRVLKNGTGTRALGGIKSDSASEAMYFNATDTSLTHSRYGAGPVKTWSTAIASILDGNYHSLAFSFNGTDCRFFRDGVFIFQHTLAAENITSIASPLDQIGAIFSGTQFTWGHGGLWGTYVSDADQLTLHNYAALEYP